MKIQKLVRLLMLAGVMLGFSAGSFAGVFVSVSIAPPPIPVYEQPLCPGAGYIWTPGYWAWGDAGYYWVPGTWVMAPQVGYLWTPGYWGWGGGGYFWHVGYWGPHVGFYGGINYGFGYGGIGFFGGEWRGRNFYYNRSVTRVNVTNITNVYNKTVVVNNNNHVSFNGGQGGVRAQATAQERRYEGERHVGMTQAQQQHFQAAARNPQLLAKNNGGKPAIAATARPADFKHTVAAKSTGGQVNRAALTATPKTTTVRGGNAMANEGAGNVNNVPKPPSAATNARENAGANSGRNEAKPSAVTSSTHATTLATPSRNVPRPPSASNNNSVARTAASANANRNVPRPSMNNSRASAPAQRASVQRPSASAPRPAAPARSYASAPRQSAPQRNSAPAQHSSGAARGNHR